MPSSIDRRRRMVWRHSNTELGLVLCSAVERRVHRHLLLPDAGYFHLRAALLALRMGSCPEDGCFAEHELETTEEDGIQCIRLHRRHYHDAVAWAVTRVGPLNDEGYTILRVGARLRLGVNGPCRV